MYTKIYRTIIIFLAILSLNSCSQHDLPPKETEGIPNGTGAFSYTYSGLPQKPINVFYHIPAGNKTNMPIVIVFHGDERNAEDYRDYWRNAANQYGFMVFAPEFTEALFPGGSSYILGNVYDDGNNPSPSTLNSESTWTFSIIEPLFDYIKHNTGNVSQTYDIFGHSGGGQFVHRFVMLKPNARYNKAIAANSGWFTVPDGVANFPYGIENSPITSTNPQQYFSRNLIIQVGALDNNGNDPSLRHNAESDLQGVNRLQRANYFFDQSQDYANSLNATFNWQLRIVPNSGHDGELMSQDAIHLLFD
ncbi:hypothetical protein D3C87_46120 [compost metagenome]